LDFVIEKPGTVIGAKEIPRQDLTQGIVGMGR